MTETYPYVIHLEPAFGPLEHIDVPAFAQQVTDRWFNQTLCRVNDSVVRLGVVQGEYHWHQHDDDDEFFYVTEGRLIIELEGRDSVELLPGHGFTVPRGLQHRPIAPVRTTMLMIETANIQPTGD